MNKFTLTSNNQSGFTQISNVFIDNFMPHANGTYVKVYIYLLRCLTSGDVNALSVSDIADNLLNTEADIVRALNYWEKINLLSITRDRSDTISCITINDASPVNTDIDYTNEPAKEELIIDSISKEIPKLNDSDTKDLDFVTSIAEKYIERMLTPNDEQLILYLYTKAGFSTEMILELYEYCASQNKKQYKYIEAVASSWIANGCNSVDKIKASIEDFNSTYKTVIKEFGINRALGQAEKDLINKWLNTYAFDIGIIKEACSRTLLTIQKPDFKYADRILNIWYQKNVKSKKDILNLDETHNKASNVSPIRQVVPASPKKTSSTNKFNSFSQRDYSHEEFAELEKRLLNR